MGNFILALQGGSLGGATLFAAFKHSRSGPLDQTGETERVLTGIEAHGKALDGRPANSTSDEERLTPSGADVFRRAREGVPLSIEEIAGFGRAQQTRRRT